MRKESDSAQFGALMAALCTTFDRQPSRLLIETYFNALADLTIEQVGRAAQLAISSCRFFPKPIELRELVESSPDDRAQAAWALLEEARAKVGYWVSVWFDDDPAMAQALTDTFGGWLAFCDQMHMVFSEETGRQIGGLSAEMQRAKQKEFLANYRRAVKAPRRIERYQPGKHETDNRATVAGWQRTNFPDGRFSQPLGILTGGEVRVISVAFDSTTAQLCDDARLMLESGNARRLIEARQIQAPTTRRSLPPKPDNSAPKMSLDEALASGDESLVGLEKLPALLPQIFNGSQEATAPMSISELAEKARMLRENLATRSEETQRGNS
jgi:hypothetical protein